MDFGKGKFGLILFFLLPGVLTSGQQGKSFIHNFDSDMNEGSIVSNDRTIIINYSIPSVELSGITNQAGEFYRVTIPGHNRSSEPGKPELPILSKLITIPGDGEVKIRISEVQSTVIYPSKNNLKGYVFPKQVDQTKQDNRQKTGFMIDKELYGRRELIKSDTIVVEYLGSIRGHKLAAVSISPVRYNPGLNQLEVITSMKIEIDLPASGNKASGNSVKSPLFSESFKKGTLNYNSDDVINGYSDKPVKMIILTDTIFKKTLDPFITWKTQKGYRVTTLYKGTAFAGNTFAEIKDSLSRIYNSSSESDQAPEYLLIVGDVNHIPISGGTSQVSDLYWGEFDGNGDYLPDMYIGRLPVADTATLSNVLGKIIKYEKFEFADTNQFYKRTLVSAGNESGYSYLMNGQLKYAMDNYLNASNNVEGHVFYYPQSFNSEDTIKKLINNGVSFVNYTGHGSVSGWLDPVIKTPEIALFTNKNMYPFIISNACQTAHFSEAESMGNKMIVSKDKGAIGFIGCTNDSYWDEDYYWAVGVGTPNADPKYSETGLGALDRLFHTHNEKPSEWYITMGQVNYAGNLAVSSSTTTRKKYYWETYSLLGDPSVIPIIGTPGNFNISLPDTLPNGITSFSISADPFAYVAISHWDTLWDASFASPSGSVVLDLPGISDDSCLVVITGQNKKPVIKKIYIRNISKEYINLTSSEVSDPKGNNNGKADFGESVYLNLTITNLGLTDATVLKAKISTSSNLVTILKDTVNIGTLNARSQITVAGKIELKVGELVPDKSFITLNLNLKDALTEKNYTIDLSLHSPVIDIVTCTIDDSETGNGNLSADPGETIKLVFGVNNSGSTNASGTFNLSGYPAGITVPQPVVSSGPINYGQLTYVTVTATVSPLLAKGTAFNVSAFLDCSPYFVSRSFSIPVGKTRESFEYQSFAVFPWKNSLVSPWVITALEAIEGKFSARSALIANNSESNLKLSINVPAADTVKFYYKVSSEQNYDFLTFLLNGSTAFRVSGESGWKEKRVALKEGFNNLEWIYKKDESISSGGDCAWLDYISFPAISFNTTDMKTGKIVTPELNKNYALEPITAEVINLGTDTVKGFNLAYSVNAGVPVAQYFNNKIRPGDTVRVAFSNLANLAGTGSYIVKVYGFNNNDEYIKNDTSSIVIVNTAITPVENPENRLLIWPNPFSSSIILSLTMDSFDEAVITIFDPSGKVIREEKRGLVPGENNITITPGDIPPGFYALRIRGNTILKAARLIKR
jgi:hypothetical protein